MVFFSPHCVTSPDSPSYDGPRKRFSIGKLIHSCLQIKHKMTYIIITAVVSTKLVRCKCLSNHILFANMQVILCLFCKDEFADRLSREGKSANGIQYIIMHWTSCTLFFYINSHFCTVMQCVDTHTHTHTHTHKSCIGDYFLPTSLSTAVPYKDTPSPDHPKPFALVWNSGKVWTRQCILQYNYEEPIILIIILYIIYWRRLFHLRFLQFD